MMPWTASIGDPTAPLPCAWAGAAAMVDLMHGLPPGERHLRADADGFNVHAHTSVGAGHKQERERLCRYILQK